ncbi:PAS domain-containing sensor histidine kinase [Intrasporangium flavum]|uniref:sensor histidine kinase n=1 Tax=Intrasporangium flavum TaxID=1428657 RepID=UPI00096DC69A|nr:PAS domain-containing sensor histidine kinase [Intrasporangium flavum]
MTRVDGSGDHLPRSADAVAPVAMMGELLPDGLVVVGPDRRIRFVNGEAARILTCTAEELVGRPLDEGLPFTDKYGRAWWEHTDPWGGLPSSRGHREKLLVAPAGQDVLVTARYVRGDDGGVERIMLGLRDAEARQRAEREQATVLSTVAHELRAPLTSVTGFTSSLLRRWDRFTDDQKRLMIETIESDATRLTRLITELLDISRLDSDSLNLRLGPVDLHAMLAGHVARYEVGRAPGAVALRLGPVAGARGLPEMWADTDRLEQIFFNLIENALQHGDGPVTVTLERDGARQGSREASGVESVVVHVDDEGDGIAPADRDKVFGRFWHGPSNASTGLGLYVVRGLVEAHGGTVHVSDNEAGGARFVVRLPAGLPAVVDP